MIRRLFFIEKDYLCGRFYTPNTHGMTDICCIGHITLDKIITPQTPFTCRVERLIIFPEV